jgi:micrococcal nuclease
MTARLLAVAVVLLAFISNPCYSKDREYQVTRVIDGDTIILETGETVRYLGIDTPEMGRKGTAPEFYAREATRYNKNLVLLKKVRLEFDVEKKDHYGRLLAYVYVKNLFVNSELVRLGYARAMIKPPNLAHKDLLIKYQREAMGKEIGLWQAEKKDTEPYYVGNKKTYIFHKPSCPYGNKIPEKGKIVFRSRVDPIKIGYSPCKRCRP